MQRHLPSQSLTALWEQAMAYSTDIGSWVDMKTRSERVWRGQLSLSCHSSVTVFPLISLDRL